MTENERNLVIGLLEDSLDKLAMEDSAAAEVLVNRALYWLQGMEEDSDYDSDEDLNFS